MTCGRRPSVGIDVDDPKVVYYWLRADMDLAQRINEAVSEELKLAAVIAAPKAVAVRTKTTWRPCAGYRL